jgi:hypothetical protein
MISLISGVRGDTDKSGSELRKKDVGMAKVSLVIAFIFILCHSIKWVPNIYELSQVIQHFKLTIQWSRASTTFLSERFVSTDRYSSLFVPN